MRDVKKAIPRRVADLVRDGGRLRRLVVTVYPNGTIGLRPERTRREEVVSAGGIWQRAVRDRVVAERQAKIKARKERRELNRR
jgi:hypothetical protein